MANRTKEQTIQALRDEVKDLRKRLVVYESEMPTIEIADRLAHRASVIAYANDDVAQQVKTADLIYKRMGAYPTKSDFDVNKANHFVDRVLRAVSKHTKPSIYAAILAELGDGDGT